MWEKEVLDHQLRGMMDQEDGAISRTGQRVERVVSTGVEARRGGTGKARSELD
jgi:hypothetical protein